MAEERKDLGPHSHSDHSIGQPRHAISVSPHIVELKTQIAELLETERELSNRVESNIQELQSRLRLGAQMLRALQTQVDEAEAASRMLIRQHNEVEVARRRNDPTETTHTTVRELNRVCETLNDLRDRVEQLSRGQSDTNEDSTPDVHSPLAFHRAAKNAGV